MKVKTNKAAQKRFKIKKSGKILRGHQMTSHLKLSKSSSRKRRQKEPGRVAKGDIKRIKRLIPYG